VRVAYDVVRPDEFEWLTRPHEPGEPARHVAELSDRAGFAHVRGNVWRYEPGAKGRRHRHPTQEETFVVLAGTLSFSGTLAQASVAEQADVTFAVAATYNHLMGRIVGVSALVYCACLAAGCGSSSHVSIGGPPHRFVMPTWLSRTIAREARQLHYPHPHTMQFKLGKRRDVVAIFGAFRAPAVTCTTIYCPSSLRMRATSVRIVASPRTHRVLSVSLGRRIASPQALGIARRSSRVLRIFRPQPGRVACLIPRGGTLPVSAAIFLRGRCSTEFVSSPPYPRGAIRVRFGERWRMGGRVQRAGWIVTVRLRDGRVLATQVTGQPPQFWK
jgi:hypothetical protein